MTQSPNSPRTNPNNSSERQPLVPVRAPILPLRIVLLIVDPEWWAKVAMYRYMISFWALFWVIVLSSFILAATLYYPWMAKCVSSARNFVVSYDQNYPPMLLNKGTLQFVGPRAKPGQYILALGNGARLLIDPSGKANVPPLAQELVMDVHVGSTKMTISYPQYQTSSDFQLSVIQQKMAMILGQIDLLSSSNQTPPITLDSKSLTKLIDNAGPTFLFFSVLFGAIPFFLLQVLWSALMIVLISPMVAIVCREVGMPLRVAYRVGTAVMAPVIAVICLLESLGIVSIENPSTDQWSAFLHLAILLSPVPAAIWAGTIANRLFGSPKKLEK